MKEFKVCKWSALWFGDVILSIERGYSWASERAEQNKWHWTSVSLYGLYLASEQQSLNRASLL